MKLIIMKFIIIIIIIIITRKLIIIIIVIMKSNDPLKNASLRARFYRFLLGRIFALNSKILGNLPVAPPSCSPTAHTSPSREGEGLECRSRVF